MTTHRHSTVALDEGRLGEVVSAFAARHGITEERARELFLISNCMSIVAALEHTAGDACVTGGTLEPGSVFKLARVIGFNLVKIMVSAGISVEETGMIVRTINDAVDEEAGSSP